MSGTPLVEVPGWYINFQAAVIKQLPRPGEIEQEIAEGWEGNQNGLKKVLAEGLLPPVPKPAPAPPAKRTLTVWRRIKGGGTTLAKLLEALGSMASHWAKDMMGKPAFIVSDKPYETDLVTLTPRELGFTSTLRTDKFVTKEFCAKWSEKHLNGQVIELCEPEDGPQLRLQYDDQPNGEAVWMAMERITDSGGDPSVFYVSRDDDGDLWLRGDYADAGSLWSLGARVVFRLRKVMPLDTGK